MTNALLELYSYITNMCPECGSELHGYWSGFPNDAFCRISPRRTCPNCDYYHQSLPKRLKRRLLLYVMGY